MNRTHFFVFLASMVMASCKKPPIEIALQPEATSLSRNIPENQDPRPYSHLPGYNVFVFGWIEHPDSILVCGYWKNGQWNNLNIQFSTIADVWVDEASEVYVFGSGEQVLDNKAGPEPFYTKGNQLVRLPSSPGYFSEVKSGCTMEGQVYSCGDEFLLKRNWNYSSEQYYIAQRDGIIWKGDKIAYRVPGVSFNKIKVIRGDIYASGYMSFENSKPKVVVYKNGILQHRYEVEADEQSLFEYNDQDELCGFNGYTYFINNKEYSLHNLQHSNVFSLKSLHYGNAGVVLAGRMAIYRAEPAAIFYTGLWRNGEFDMVENRFWSELTGVTQQDEHEWVTGNIRTKDNKLKAILWVDGVCYLLESFRPNNTTIKLFVRKQ